jgi:hypothetical protein
MIWFKSIIRQTISIIANFLIPNVSFKSGINYKLLGADEHFFVGYYDIDPVSELGDSVLCHKVSKNFSNMIEPTEGEIGLLSIETNKFISIATTKALNWQLGSRVQWLDRRTIIYNDIVDDVQCSKVIDVISGSLIRKFVRPFWAISPNKQVAASLNFSRIKKKRPGYGYNGINIDGDNETLTLFNLKTDEVLFQIDISKIMGEIGFDKPHNTDPYLNHITWSPCSSKFITIFHFEESKGRSRKIYPVLIDCTTHKCSLIHSSGCFSHHVWCDSERLLAYIEEGGKMHFSIWTHENGWKELGEGMPKMDGHPSPVTGSNNIVVDSYPDRLGRMSLYLGTTSDNSRLQKIGTIMSPTSYKGALRCDLHPRVSNNDTLIVCDVPFKDGRRIMIIEGVFDDK